MFIQSKIARGFALGTSDGEESWLLPISPISFVQIKLDFQTAAANVADTVLLALAHLISIQVRYRGAQIVSVSGSDLARLTKSITGWAPQLWNPATADNSLRSLNLILPFGRRLFDPNQAFPATSKGESELFIQWDAVTSNYDVMDLDISTFELPNATPKEFLRYTTMTDTPSATGDKDYDLPRLAPLAGVGFFQTASVPDNATPTINSVRMLVNNQDYGYTDYDPISARDLTPFNMGRSTADLALTQQENSAGSYTQNAETVAPHTLDGLDRDWFYLDYDPNRDGAHLIPGPASSEVKARVNFGATSAIRILPVEVYTPELLPNYRKK